MIKKYDSCNINIRIKSLRKRFLMEEKEVKFEVIDANNFDNSELNSEYIQEIILEVDSSPKDVENDNEIEFDSIINYDSPYSTEDNLVDLEDEETIQTFPKDIRDIEKVNEFYGDEAIPCCTSNCNKLIPEKIALEHRYQFMELDKREQDIFILSYIQAHRRLPGLENQYGKRSRRGQLRLSNNDHIMKFDIVYYFAAFVVCQKFFFFIHEIGKKRFRNLLSHYKKNGISPRIHKSRYKVPNRANVLKVADIDSVVTFMKSYAEKFAKPSPRCEKNRSRITLPPTETTVSVYRKYCEFMSTEPHSRIMGRSSFRKIWKKHTPHILISKSIDARKVTIPKTRISLNQTAED